MLIDTNSIIQMTDLRQNLSKISKRVKRGEKLYVSDRGDLCMQLLPVAPSITPYNFTEKSKTERAEKTVDEIEELAQRLAAKGFGKWNSLKAIKKQREDRTKHLLKIC